LRNIFLLQKSTKSNIPQGEKKINLPLLNTEVCVVICLEPVPKAEEEMGDPLAGRKDGGSQAGRKDGDSQAERRDRDPQAGRDDEDPQAGRRDGVRRQVEEMGSAGR
jgi:hypothetical protein